MKQLVLDLVFSAPEPFMDFVVGENIELLSQLREWVFDVPDKRFMYLWGEPHCGKTHLLRAAASQSGADYFDAGCGVWPELFEGRKTFIVDNVDLLSPEHQIRLFDLYNSLRENAGRFLAAGRLPPMQLELLPDLATRLGWGLVYQLKLLQDNEKIAALIQYAERLGFELPEGLAKYLLRYANRDLCSLYKWVEKANVESLSRHSPVTMPMLRALLSEGKN